MKKLLVMFCMATTMASAQSRTCDVKQSEQRVREVIQALPVVKVKRWQSNFLTSRSWDHISAALLAYQNATTLARAVEALSISREPARAARRVRRTRLSMRPIP